jgi:hypothetical protein
MGCPRELLGATLGRMPEFSKELHALITRQDGVVTRAQLVAHGVSPAAVRWNSGGSWRVLLPHVVVLSRETPRPRQRLVAGLLWLVRSRSLQVPRQPRSTA